MAGRFGWGKNGGDSMGDVKAALAGRAFGGGPNLTYAISPTKTTVDASAGSDFYFKMPASSVVKIGNPTAATYDDGTELRFHVAGITTFGTIVWDTLYKTTGSFATFSTGKVKSIAFTYLAATGYFSEIWRTTSKTG